MAITAELKQALSENNDALVESRLLLRHQTKKTLKEVYRSLGIILSSWEAAEGLQGSIVSNGATILSDKVPPEMEEEILSKLSKAVRHGHQSVFQLQQERLNLAQEAPALLALLSDETLKQQLDGTVAMLGGLKELIESMEEEPSEL